MPDIEDFEERRLRRELVDHIAEAREREAAIETYASLSCHLLNALNELMEAGPTVTLHDLRQVRIGHSASRVFEASRSEG